MNPICEEDFVTRSRSMNGAKGRPLRFSISDWKEKHSVGTSPSKKAHKMGPFLEQWRRVSSIFVDVWKLILKFTSFKFKLMYFVQCRHQSNFHIKCYFLLLVSDYTARNTIFGDSSCYLSLHYMRNFSVCIVLLSAFHFLNFTSQLKITVQNYASEASFVFWIFAPKIILNIT